MVGHVVLVVALVFEIGVRAGNQRVDELGRRVLDGQIEEVVEVWRVHAVEACG